MTIQFRPVDSLQVMAYIIKRCDSKDIPLNITKLQKLMYCCYGAVLGKFGVRLTDEYPAAWQYGPVFPEALRSVQFFTIDPFKEKDTPDIDSAPAEILQLIDGALECFGKYSASELSRWTHLKGSPWYKASDGGASLYGRLSDEDVASYFREEVLA